MTMTTTVQTFLEVNDIPYDLVPHRMTSTSMNSAQSARIKAEQLAKPVIFEDDIVYLMAVIPANQHVKIGKLNQLLNRKMGLTTETELEELFEDCVPGAIPPLGPAYNIQCIIDDELFEYHDIYFEAGNHEELVHIKGEDFQRLMRGAPHSHICLH